VAIFKFIVSIYLLSLSFSFSVPVLAETQCDWLAEDCRQHQPLSLESVQATSDETDSDLFTREEFFKTEEYESIIAAAAEEETEAVATNDSGNGEPVPAECVKFADDVDADLGEVLRAGCQPTLEQMSALMDNPLGNVAMLFTQIDHFRLENPDTGKPANMWNYMGIAQFPKKVNLIYVKASSLFIHL